MRRPYLIRVSRDGIDKKVPCPILVTNRTVDSTRECAEVILQDARVVYTPDAPTADGAVVYIEAVNAYIPPRPVGVPK